PDLRYTGSGGKVASSTAGEIVFVDWEGNKLSHEIESYTSTSGNLVAWVKMPFMSSTSTRSIYLYYGNAAADYQPGNSAVWDSNYKGVWHMNNGTASTTDSTINTNTGSNIGVTNTAGQIDGAGSFDGSSSYVDVGNVSTMNSATQATWSFWMNQSSLVNSKFLLSKYDANFGATSWAIQIPSSGLGVGNDEIAVYFTAGDVGATNTNVLVAGNWYHVTAVYDGSQSTNATKLKMYVNGQVKTLVFAGTVPASLPVVARTVKIGAESYNAGDPNARNYFNGVIDEPRVSNIARSADWIKTEYTNQSSPSTFFTLGAEEVPTLASLPAPTPPAAPAGSSWYNSSWAYRKQLTTDPAKVAGPLTNFPMLVSFTDPDLRYTGSGGKVASSTAGEIVFVDWEGNKLSHEIESYTSTSGNLVAWVKMPFMSSTSTRSIYLYYGNAAADYQPGNSATWSNGYTAVWHFKETSGQHMDSAGVNNSTVVSVTAQGTAVGRIGGADTFDGGSNRITVGDNDSLEGMAALTIEAWVMATTGGSDAYQRIVDKVYGQAYGLYISDNNALGAFITTTGSGSGTSDWYSNEFGKVVTDNTYQQVVFTWDSATAQANFYLDTMPGTPAARDGDNVGTGTGNFYIGDNIDSSRSFAGSIDELRVSNVARSAAWITTEYVNQTAPASFLAYSGQQTPTRQDSSGNAAPAEKSRGGTRARGGVKFRLLDVFLQMAANDPKRDDKSE
ncbi:MAG: DUF2341 domain-containing protein, partial [Patescibacteria group bacterium]|nr:DUF2341 domain-containing protein [Patescibacteria group bacterium]